MSKDTADKDSIMEALTSSAADLGHRLGNFHNYYHFHPPSNRLEHMEGILSHLKGTTSRKRLRVSNDEDGPSSVLPFRYCDLGCNEGDLTVEIAKALQDSVQQPIEFIGMDIDAELIERANTKWTDIPNVLTGSFEAGNICTDLDRVFKDNSMDLISLLSTTMWVHVHAGDKGLMRVLEQLCRKSRRYLIIEPQPSKCYRNAMTRLRKMGRPELEVSSERLQWRPKLEEEIGRTLNRCSFYLVELTGNKPTSWNRSISLYQKRDT
jgi:SAM-dependent methyltransferase